MSRPIVRTSDLSCAARAGFDAIIDVRAPVEFAHDHLPGAINLPVLDDAERAEVGTIYKQVSPFAARCRGAALVARNIAAALEGPLADAASRWRPLVYCWRGGQRSGAMATVLAEVGWTVAVLEGGYKTWRRQVVAALHDDAAPLPLVVLDGQTGTGKTAVLQRLAARGVQTIDLEGLARHRGSAFGAGPGAGQPSQPGFETALYAGLERLDLERPIVVEAESALVGVRRIPPRLWRAMQTAPRIELVAPLEARAHFLVRSYADLIQDGVALQAALDRLTRFHPRADLALWRSHADAGRAWDLAAALIGRHYDPAYDRARAGRAAPRATIPCGALDEADLDRAAAAVASCLEAPRCVAAGPASAARG